jgi:hypothetical protein
MINVLNEIFRSDYFFLILETRFTSSPERVVFTVFSGINFGK